MGSRTQANIQNPGPDLLFFNARERCITVAVLPYVNGREKKCAICTRIWAIYLSPSIGALLVAMHQCTHPCTIVEWCECSKAYF